MYRFCFQFDELSRRNLVSPCTGWGKELNFLSFHLVPRYVRVNTLVSSAEDVCSQLAEEGWNLVRLKKKKTSYEEFLAKVRDLGEKDFLMDYHLDFLLVFPPSAQFHDHSLLLNGSILLQDKVYLIVLNFESKFSTDSLLALQASCLPPVALSNAFDGPILDACSAPGMKTTLLAALSNNRWYTVCHKL